MAAFRLAVVLLLLLSMDVGCNAEFYPIHLQTAWLGGLTGDVTIHTDQPIHGWKVHLVFENVYDNVMALGFGSTTRINAHEWVIQPTALFSQVLPGYPLTVVIEALMGHGVTATSDHVGTYFVEVHSNTDSDRTTQEATTTSTKLTTSSSKPTIKPSTKSVAQTSYPIHLLAAWSGGLTGDVTIHTDQPIHGWKVHLVFENVYDSVYAHGYGSTTRISDHEWVIQNVDWDGIVLPGSPTTVYIEAAMGHGVTATSGHVGIYYLEGHSDQATAETTSTSSKLSTATSVHTFKPSTAVPQTTLLKPSTGSSATLKTITMPPSTTYRPSTGLIVLATSPKHTNGYEN